MAKYTVYYERKVRTLAYEMLTIGMSQEFDTADSPYDDAFLTVRLQVEREIEENRDRIVEKSVRRPDETMRSERP